MKEKQPTTEELKKKRKLLKELQKSEKAVNSSQREARNEYKQDVKNGDTDLDFATWCMSYAKSYLAELAEYNDVNAQLRSFLIQIYGANREVYQADLQRLSSVVVSPDQDIAG